MRVLRVILTGVFSILVALGVVGIFRGTISIYAALLIILYFYTALALNGNGGKYSRYIGLVTGGLLSLCLFASLYFITEIQQEKIILSVFLLFGFIGLGTLICLIKQPTEVVDKNT